MEKSEKKEIIQIYMNNLVKIEDKDIDSELKSILLKNNKIIIKNYDDTEGKEEFIKLFSSCSKEMCGKVEPEYEYKSGGVDVYDTAVSLRLDLGTLIANGVIE